MSLALFPETTHSMEDRCMQSLTTIKGIVRGMHKTTSGDSSTELTTSIDSSLPSNTSATYRSPPRLRATAKPLDSSSNTKKKYEKSRSVCGKLASSKMQVGVDWKELTRCTGLKRHWWIWIAGRGYNMETRGARNVGIPPEKGVMLRNDV